jgi:predicted transcriptional regulator
MEYTKVLFLLMSGWANLSKIQEALGYSDEQMKSAVDRLKQEGYIVTHTIH